MTSVRQCVAVRCQCVNALAGCECVSASVRYWMTHTHTHTQHALGEVESVSVRQCVSATPLWSADHTHTQPPRRNTTITDERPKVWNATDLAPARPPRAGTDPAFLALALTVCCPVCPAKHGQHCVTRLPRGYHIARADKAVRRSNSETR